MYDMTAISLPVIDLENCSELLEMLEDIYRAEKTDSHYVVQREDLDRLKNERGETLLSIAAKIGNLKILKLLIEADADVNVQNESGETPLMLALLALQSRTRGYFKYRQVMKVLCDSNANIYVTDKRGMSPLRFVLANLDPGYDFVHALFVEVIYRECGYNSQITAKQLMHLNCPLWPVVELKNAEIIERMLARGCSVDSYHPAKRTTALSRAVELGNLEMVKVLIEYGADPDIVDSEANLAINHLPDDLDDNRQSEIIELLVTKSTLGLGDSLDFQYVKKAFEQGNRRVIRMMIERVGLESPVGPERTFPLHWLARNRHSDVTEELRDREIDVNVRDISGWTPFHYAAKCPGSHINNYRFLLENGADPAATGTWRSTPLFDLCTNESITEEKFREIVDLLILHGLDFYFEDGDEIIVLLVIASHRKNFMAEPLLKHLAVLDEMKKPITIGIRMVINDNAEFKSYFDFCKVELAKMKSVVVDEKLTLYTVMVGQVSYKVIVKSCNFSENAMSNLVKLKKEVQPNDCFYSLVQRRISCITLKLELFQKASLVLCKLLNLGNNPYHIVVTEIMNYLNSDDHRNLVALEI